jgi:hypothetical protein
MRRRLVAQRSGGQSEPDLHRHGYGRLRHCLGQRWQPGILQHRQRRPVQYLRTRAAHHLDGGYLSRPVHGEADGQTAFLAALTGRIGVGLVGGEPGADRAHPAAVDGRSRGCLGRRGGAGGRRRCRSRQGGVRRCRLRRDGVRGRGGRVPGRGRWRATCRLRDRRRRDRHRRPCRCRCRHGLGRRGGYVRRLLWLRRLSGWRLLGGERGWIRCSLCRRCGEFHPHGDGCGRCGRDRRADDKQRHRQQSGVPDHRGRPGGGRTRAGRDRLTALRIDARRGLRRAAPFDMNVIT